MGELIFWKWKRGSFGSAFGSGRVDLLEGEELLEVEERILWKRKRGSFGSGRATSPFGSESVGSRSVRGLVETNRQEAGCIAVDVVFRSYK